MAADRFDQKLDYDLKSLSLDRLTLPEVDIREERDEEFVEELMDAFRKDLYPSIHMRAISIDRGATYVLVDGIYRFMALRRLQKTGTLVETVQVLVAETLDEKMVIQERIQANHGVGMRMTNADKRRAVKLALKTFGKFSDARIAEVCKVSPHFVGDVRKDLGSERPDKVLGRDGKLQTVGRKRMPPSSETTTAQRSLATVAGRRASMVGAAPPGESTLATAGTWNSPVGASEPPLVADDVTAPLSPPKEVDEQASYCVPPRPETDAQWSAFLGEILEVVRDTVRERRRAGRLSNDAEADRLHHLAELMSQPPCPECSDEECERCTGVRSLIPPTLTFLTLGIHDLNVAD